MAVLAPVLLDKNISKDHIERKYKVILIGNYDAVNGVLIDFTQTTDPKKWGRRMPPYKPLPTTDQLEVGASPNGFTAGLAQNAVAPTLQNYVMRVWSIATAAELATAAFPAGALNNAVYFTVRTLRRSG